MHGGHTRELHAVIDDVMDVSIGHALRLIRMQVGNAGILVGPNRSCPSTIDSVTRRAPRKKSIPSLLERDRIAGKRIVSTVFGSGNCKVAG